MVKSEISSKILRKGYAQIHVGAKPEDIEQYTTSRKGIWKEVIDKLQVIDATQTVWLDVTGCTQARITNIKTGIQKCARTLHYNKKLIFGLKGNTLHVWVN